MSPVTVIRAGWGAALLVAPGAVLGCLPRQRIDRPARAVARLLGARQPAQAAIADSARGSRPSWLLAGAAVDATHAATMIVLAMRIPDRRRPALTNAAMATAFALGGVAQATA